METTVTITVFCDYVSHHYEMKTLVKYRREKHRLANLTFNIINKIYVYAISLKKPVTYVTIVMLCAKNLHNNYSVLRYAIPIVCDVHDMHVMRETMYVISHIILQIHSCTML